MSLTIPDPPASSGRIGWIVVASLAAGIVGALLLVLLVFAGRREHIITGATLLAFGLSWAMLGLLSTRRTDQPQRWAFLPAVCMVVAGAGLLLFAPGDGALAALGWIWPPLLLALAVWMVIQARRELHSGTRGWLVYPVCVLMMLAAVGGATETVLEVTGDALHAPAGQTFDVGGHRLYMHCTGRGSPTVLLTNGAGERSPHWAWVAPAVAKDTRVCVYDRAGQGWSESAGRQDGIQLATDLHVLLARAHVGGPYVLAGHSVGGIYDLVFAARYPAEVAGVVLLDSTTPEQFTAIPTYRGFYSIYRRLSALIPSLARMGAARAVARLGGSSLPKQARDQERAFSSTARDFRAQSDEWSEFPTAFNQAKALHDLGGKPLIVITASKGQEAGWFAAQDKLATLSSDNVHRTINGATHSALLEDERYATKSSDAIREVVRAVRTGTQLMP